MEWGLVVPVIDGTWASVEADVAFADRNGVDSVWLWDHLMGTRNPTDDVLEAWTTLAAVAASTEKVRLGHLVTCISYRNVGLLAKMATTVDHISGGRLELGLGAGWYEEEYAAFGFNFPRPGDRRRALAEAIEAIRLLFAGGPVDYDGEYVTLAGARCDPVPLQQPSPPITIGAGGPLMRKLTAEVADAWTCPAQLLPQLGQMISSVREAAGGRTVRVTANIPFAIGVDEADAAAAREAAHPTLDWMGDIDAIGVTGRIPEAVEQVERLADSGVGGIQCQLPVADRQRRLEAFAALIEVWKGGHGHPAR